MNSLLHLLSIFSLVTTTGFVHEEVPVETKEVSSVARYAPSTDVRIHFSGSAPVNVGDPVLFNGEQVGSVTRVQHDDNLSGTDLFLLISENFLPTSITSSDFVGLASSVNSKAIPNKKADASNLLSSYVDLIHVSVSKNPSKFDFSDKKTGSLVGLRGFTSLKEFWGSSLNFQPRS